MDIDKTFGKVGRWHVHKDNICCIDSILQTAAYKKGISIVIYLPSKKSFGRDEQDSRGDGQNS